MRGSIHFANSIAWWNASQPLEEGVVAEHSLVEGGHDGPGVIDADPLFRQLPPTRHRINNDENGDLGLQSGSPAIDAGLTSLLPLDLVDLDGDGNSLEPLPTDLDGNLRVWGAAPDLGAYEFGAPPVTSEPDAVRPALALLLMPNPTREDAMALLRLAAPTDARVSVFDTRGRQVLVLHEGPLSAGEHRFPIPRELPSGVYLIRASDAGGARTVPLTVVR